MNNLPRQRFSSELADRCVKCGLCLPHCPTYDLARDEGESPRGRISLMQGLASGQLEASPELLGHLDRCLTCRSCERACPAEVPYGALLDATRADLAAQGVSTERIARLSAWILTRPALARLLAACLRLAARLGLLSAAKRIGPNRLQRLLHRIPTDLRGWRNPTELVSQPSRKNSVNLFTGCLTPLFDARTIEDAIRVIEAMGYEVLYQPEQTCCGAIHLHAGRALDAARLAARNQLSFADPAIPVIGLASGCTATMSEYEANGNGSGNLADNVWDIVAWLADHHDCLPTLKLPEPVECVVHSPCSQTNIMRNHLRLEAILNQISNLTWRHLNPKNNCCGAAGVYMISQGETADALADQHLESLGDRLPDVLLCANIGCALHLQGALNAQQNGTRVEHPISLIARALPDKNQHS